MKIPLTQSEDRARNEERCSGEDKTPCIVCGRPVEDAKVEWHLHLTDGGASVTDDHSYESFHDPGDMGMHPIGAGCMKRHPEYRRFAVRMVEPDV